jgi:hypothetical protein
MPPASLSDAPAGRLERLVKDDATLQKVAEMNPAAVPGPETEEDAPAAGGMKAVEEF